MDYRIGIGYDIHRLAKGRKLFLGGVEISYPQGLLGHSDADVLMHAICDALLGAASLGDIGEIFPDRDAKYLNAASADLLKEVYRLVRSKGYTVCNIDSVIIAEEPAVLPFKKQMQEGIARILNLEKDLIGIKATTNEGVGEIGKKKAIAAYAVVLLDKEGK